VVNSQYFPIGKHYDTTPINYPTTHHCVFALRLADNKGQQTGYATYTKQQRMIYGFQTEIHFIINFPLK